LDDQTHWDRIVLSDAPAWLQQRGDELILTLRIQPRASRDEVVGAHGDALKVRITAPPVDGKANSHLCSYLAHLFKVPKSQVSLLSGESGRDKRVSITAPRQLPEFITILL